MGNTEQQNSVMKDFFQRLSKLKHEHSLKNMEYQWFLNLKTLSNVYKNTGMK